MRQIWISKAGPPEVLVVKEAPDPQPAAGETRIRVDVYECVTCSGLKTVGRPLCHFEGGLIAGVVESILKKRTRAHEITCIGGLGDKACGFDLELKPLTQT